MVRKASLTMASLPSLGEQALLRKSIKVIHSFPGGVILSF